MLIGIIGKNVTNLKILKEFFEECGYDVAVADDHSESDKLYSADVVLIELTGFDSGIWDFCEDLRGRKIPFILFYSSKVDVALTKGAEAAAFKPVNPETLLKLVKDSVDERTRD